METSLIPKYKLSQQVCFFSIQYTSALFTNIINFVIKGLVTVSPAWSALTLTVTTEPHPRGSSMFGVTSPLPETWSNFLGVQSQD